MTVNAKLAGKIETGHGLTSKLTEQVFHDMAAGKPTEQIVCIAILTPDQYGASANNTKRHVTFKAERLEPVTDQDEADRLRIAMADAAFTTRTSRPGIPLAFPGWDDNEQHRFLLDSIEEWREQEGVEPGELKDVFQDYFGGPDFAPKDLRKASVLQLREFALAKGALADETAGTDDDVDTGDPADE